MDKKEESQGSSKYWLSLDQWRQDPQFNELAQNEFLSSPFAPEDSQSGWARREFMKLMGASLALTSFGCTRKAQQIVPYVKRPEEVIPGIANYYASSYVDGNEVFGTVVTTREGRPIKIEGNELHPMNRGALSARAHAHILGLYDPDRLTEPKKNLLNEKKSNRDTVGVSWESLDKDIVKALNSGSAAILTGTIQSPSTQKLLGEFRKAFSLKSYTVDDIDGSVLRKGQKESYGESVLPRYRFDKAQMIVSLGADFLGTYLSPVEFTKDFKEGRSLEGEMSKLVVFEPVLSLTGTNADERYRVKSRQLVNLTMAIVKAIVVEKGRSSYANNTKLRASLEPFTFDSQLTGVEKSVVEKVAEELWENRGKGLVIAGGMSGQTQDALELQVAVNFLNTLLENDGQTIEASGRTSMAFQGQASDLVDLLKAIKEGTVKTLIVHGINPVYSAPGALNVAGVFAELTNLIYVGDSLNETALLANYVASEHHALENWGDYEGQEGVLSLQQPTIRPLYNTRSFQDSLLAWAKGAEKKLNSGGAETWYDYLANNWKSIYTNNRSKAAGAGDFDKFWIDLKQKGVFDLSKEASRKSRNFKIDALASVKPVQTSGFELNLYETSGLRDGSLANVPWLQEFPDPVTKIVWDNYLCVSPKTASVNHLQEGEMVSLNVGEVKRKVPVHIQPGQHDDVLALAVGYGRTAAGKVANGVGVKAFDLATTVGDQIVYSGLDARFYKTKEKIMLANVQGHHSMEGRQIVVEGTLQQFKSEPDKVVHRHKIFSMWEKHKYEGKKWAMSVDLNSCTGCGSCIVACQSENNIPTVGKKYVLKGREMHWMRVDRYYVGNPDDPNTVHQPVMCQHCENAPCETVCPVAATVHSDEGTNDMIYNRCVGTRYCANNCPYKVRRFNWFNYTNVRSPLHMAMNPEVTVRARGVMEKCTFCIHRIKQAKHNALVEKREFEGSSVKTACQQTCPADAIQFGDLNDEASVVVKDFKDVRSYDLLEELNNAPRVKYKYKVRNTEMLKGGDSHGHDSKGGHA